MESHNPASYPTSTPQIFKASPHSTVGPHGQASSKLGIPRLASWGGTRVSLTPGVRQKHLSPLASLFVGYRWHRTRWNALDMDTHTRAINICTLTVARDHSSYLTYPTAQPVKHNTSFPLFLVSVGKKIPNYLQTYLSILWGIRMLMVSPCLHSSGILELLWAS